MERCIQSELNDIYEPLCAKSDEVCDCFKKAGYKISVGFYNNHSVRKGEGFFLEHYPIPVIKIMGIGDVGIDIDSVWMEVIITKDEAFLLDYSELARSHSIEIYGVENYLHDFYTFYNEKADAGKIIDKIRNSEETQICINFTFGADCNPNELVCLAKKSKNYNCLI